MAGNVEIIGQWKKTEKKMMDDAFNRLLDEATKNTGEYIREHGPNRSKFSLFITKVTKVLGIYNEAAERKLDEMSWSAADKYNLAVRLAEGNPEELQRINDLKPWMDTFFTVGMAIGRERDSVAIDFFRKAFASSLTAANDYEFAKRFLLDAGFGKKSEYDQLPDLAKSGYAPIDIGLLSTFNDFMNTVNRQYGIEKEDIAGTMGGT